ncbi:MAG: WbqC family protein [Candidatus Bathyarchaeota archaeon]|nr:WbqC family protein [Candidatus Bathyarchaeota archaeon]
MQTDCQLALQDTQRASEQVEHLCLDDVLILSGHQPTLLPYPGFFYRMFHSNIMDICPYDPLSRHSDRFVHRVKIGTDNQWRWLTLPIEASAGCAIKDAKLKAHLMPSRWAELERVYGKYPLWSTYREDLKEVFFSYSRLWELNLRLIIWMRDLLGIKTYLSISYGSEGSDTTERIASQFSRYGSVVYLAGKGSLEYLDVQKYERLTHSTTAVVTYTPPAPYATVSMLTPIMKYPADKVLEVLNIRREPIKVIINGTEYSANYLNS